ncbi:MAG: PAS domain S-box protein [Actinobacteria bacterium]|nr:PAS domain S-box protein [Actinomycetota bacterium]
MKDESKTKEELIKDLKTLRKKGEKSAVNNIIERKQAEGKLQDSEEYLKMLFDYAPGAYYISDLKGNFIGGNKAAEKLTGYKEEELIGKNFLKLKLLSLAYTPKAAKLLVKSLRGQPTGPDEFILNRKDNSKVTVEISTYPIKIKGRTLVLGMANDITERKKAIKEIEELAKFPAEDPNPVLRISKDGTVLYHNHSSESLLEHWHYQEGKALQDRWIQLVLDALRADNIKTVETKMDDKVIFLTFAPIAEKDFVNVYGSDITELKQGEERIKHLNLVLRAIRNINQLIFKEKDREGLIKGVCNSLTETRGYYSSFIVLLDEEGKIDTYAEAGLGKDFLPMLERLKRGELTTFGQIALKQEEVVIIKDPASACPDCPLAQVCSDRGSVMTVRLGRDGKIYGVMSVSIPTHFITDKEEQALFMEAAGDVALGLNSIEMEKKLDKQTHDLKQRVKELKRAMDATIETMSKIVEAKDPYTAGHQQRVSQLTTAIAKELNLSQDKVEGIRIASLIHDIGKIGLPTEILSKPTKLSDIEFSLIKEHSQIGYDILKSIDFSYPVAQIVLQHHERLNGSGYPNHLKGDEIFLEARILGVTDVVEAISSHRPYRAALGVNAALGEIAKNKEILYDPKVVDICIKLFKEKGFKFE